MFAVIKSVYLKILKLFIFTDCTLYYNYNSCMTHALVAFTGSTFHASFDTSFLYIQVYLCVRVQLYHASTPTPPFFPVLPVLPPSPPPPPPPHCSIPFRFLSTKNKLHSVVQPIHPSTPILGLLE